MANQQSKRWQYSLSSLFWLTLAVACFMPAAPPAGEWFMDNIYTPLSHDPYYVDFGQGPSTEPIMEMEYGSIMPIPFEGNGQVKP